MALRRTEIDWTNRLVVEFAGEQDPISAIKHAVRKLVFRAKENGWTGPPFNPLFLAEMMGIPVVANAGIPDARTVFSDNQKTIEYNPGQIRERVRFSIAHELAHLLFVSDQEPIRNRGGTVEYADDWQLEMLCNLAASEFVMPIGSLPTRIDLPTIEELMVDRRKFDVSAEAFLIRMVKTSFEPVTMFCASIATRAEVQRQYRIDYTVPSINSSKVPIVGKRVPGDSVISRCTAIGYTDASTETWVDGQGRFIECVGIPGYPGTDLPRVAGLIRSTSTSEKRHPIRYVHGNVLNPRGEGNRLICQLVNDRARRWGGGVARRSARKFPDAEIEFGEWIIERARRDRLGNVHFSTACDGIVIASLVAQEGYGPSLFPRIRYGALEMCLRDVGEYCKARRFSVHMPRIGAGESGGAWEIVEEILDEYLVPLGLSVTVYDLPPKRPQLELFE